jgi:hypothetical protein
MYIIIFVGQIRSNSGSHYCLSQYVFYHIDYNYSCFTAYLTKHEETSLHFVGPVSYLRKISFSAYIPFPIHWRTKGFSSWPFAY